MVERLSSLCGLPMGFNEHEVSACLASHALAKRSASAAANTPLAGIGEVTLRMRTYAVPIPPVSEPAALKHITAVPGRVRGPDASPWTLWLYENPDTDRTKGANVRPLNIIDVPSGGDPWQLAHMLGFTFVHLSPFVNVGN